MSLYRKYRPSKFSEVVGQVHIVKTLSNAIQNDRIGHAYLFTGPRGTGKTTLARIFAKAVNCREPLTRQPGDQTTDQPVIEPCGKCEPCELIQKNQALDLVEIDAASHTGVDNIRQLKETVSIPPTALKYRIYIIDEVHMLSMGAFNALLKTLEEPPAHAIFILATTELHKIPETILSRCQRFDFNRFTQDQIINRLKQIAESEKVEIDDEALETIALEAEGGMRDAESLMGQIISLQDKKITAEEVNQILGTSSKRLAMDLVALMLQDEAVKALEEIERIQGEGVNLKNVNKNILSYLRSLLLLKTDPSAVQLVPNLTKEQLADAQELIKNVTLAELLKLVDLFQQSLNEYRTATIPQLPLEMAIIGFHVHRQGPAASAQPTAASPMPNPGPGAPLTPPPAPQPYTPPSPPSDFQPPAPPQPPDSQTTSQPVDQSTNPPSDQPTDQPDLPPANVAIGTILDRWSAILEGVKPFNHSIHAGLINCVPVGFVDGYLCIKTKYEFYKDKLNEPQNKLTVQGVIAKIIGGAVKVKYVTEKECERLKFSQGQPDNQDRNILHDAMQILGGKIVDS